MAVSVPLPENSSDGASSPVLMNNANCAEVPSFSLPAACVCKYVLTVSHGMLITAAAPPAQAPMAASHALLGSAVTAPWKRLVGLEASLCSSLSWL